MTNTATCLLMNGIYKIVKPLTIAQNKQAKEIASREQTGENPLIAVYRCDETIGRKSNGNCQ